MPIPLYPDLPIPRIPWVTVVLILVCLGLHIVKTTNDHHNAAFASALSEAHTSELLRDVGFSNDDIEGTYVREDIDAFADDLLILTNYPYAEADFEKWLDARAQFLTSASTNELGPFSNREEALLFLDRYEKHLFEAAEELYFNGRWSPERSFIEHTKHFNPFRWITSTLIHADWWHVIFNVVFFFAFATIVEILIDNWRVYLGLLLAIGLVIGFSDWAFNTFGKGYYSLGLSGIVMGTMGVSAYLYPRARIRIFEMFTWYYGRTLSAPVWMLAIFFIGGDVVTLMSGEHTNGINVFAHVTGGISGFLLAAYFFRDRKEDIRDELDAVIESRRSRRADRLGTLDSSTTNSPRVIGQQIQRQNDQLVQRALDEIYRDINLNHYSDATIRLVYLFDDHAKDISAASEIFERIKAWPPSIVSLNAARLVIYRLLILKRTREALDIIRWATDISPDFVLGDPKQTPIIKNSLETIGELDTLRDWIDKQKASSPVMSR